MSHSIFSTILSIFLQKYKVSGHSMEPSISPGDKVLASKIPYLFFSPKIRDVVVIRHEGVYMVKRIKKIEYGEYFLTGDNPSDSLDSRQLGTVTKKEIVGKVIAKL